MPRVTWWRRRPGGWACGDRRPFVERPDAIPNRFDIVEVIPRRLLAVLALPEGRLEPGRAVHMKNGLQWRLAKMHGAEATLFVTDSAAASGHSATQAPKPEAADLMVRFDRRPRADCSRRGGNLDLHPIHARHLAGADSKPAVSQMVPLARSS